MTIGTLLDHRESRAEVALTITVAGSGTVAGAVYCPVASMVPQPAPEQPDPETLQTKLWLTPFGLLPSERITFALNCCRALITTIGPGEKIVTPTGPPKDDVVVEDGVVGVSRLLHAVSVSARMTPRMRVARRMEPAFREMRDDRNETDGLYSSAIPASTERQEVGRPHIAGDHYSAREPPRRRRSSRSEALKMRPDDRIALAWGAFGLLPLQHPNPSVSSRDQPPWGFSQ